MSTWLVIVVGAALMGVLLAWHSIARGKETSEVLLREYAKLLAEAREKMFDEATEVTEVADQRPPGTPTEP